MTGPTFEDQLGDWIKDGPERAPHEVLGSVLATFPTTRQRWGVLGALWRFSTMTRSSSALAGAAVVLLVFGVGAFVLSRPGPGGAGDVATPPAVVATESPSASPVPTPSPAAATASPDVTPSPTAVPTPTATPAPTVAPCPASVLTARITMWEGAAGSRIAHVELTNGGSVECLVATLDRPQLLGGNSAILIDGMSPTGSVLTLGLAAGASFTTLVQTTNYCGPDPVAPVTVAFVLDVASRVVAAPASATDTTVPPCNGPGQPAEITMHPWAP